MRQSFLLFRNHVVLACLLTLALGYRLELAAQQSHVERITMEGQYGYIIPHASDLIPISQTNPVGIRLAYDRMRINKKSWDACNCFHYLGIQLIHHRFGNPEVLGHATTLAGAFEPILFSKGSWDVTLSTGIGLTYLNRVFDAEQNPTNTFFSAPVSFLLFLSPKVQYRFSDVWSASLSTHYNHISNGGQRQPNRGINYPTLGLGISYLLKNPSRPDFSAEVFPKTWKWYGEVFGTLKANVDAEGRSPAYGLSLGTFRQIGPVNAFGAGWEIAQDRSQVGGNGPFMQGILLNHHFLFGRFDFSQRMGYYLRKPENYANGRSFYQRYTLLYGLMHNWRLGASLKAHGHVAENIELRIGYVF